MGLRSFLERRGRRRIERRIGQLMRPGEEVLDFDIGRNMVYGRGGERTDFIATTRALYIYQSRSDTVRALPYAEIHTVTWNPESFLPIFMVRPTPLHRGSPDPVMVSLIRPVRGMAGIVQRRVKELVEFERQVPYSEPGPGATFRRRPWEEDGDLMWDIRFDDEIEDASSEKMQAWMRSQIKSLSAELGIPFEEDGETLRG